MKIGTDTRDRLRSLAREGDSLEDVVVAALDEYESRLFWRTADDSIRSETDEQRVERRRLEAETDHWMDSLQ